MPPFAKPHVKITPLPTLLNFSSPQTRSKDHGRLRIDHPMHASSTMHSQLWFACPAEDYIIRNRRLELIGPQWWRV
jgi:hypothetical protein